MIYNSNRIILCCLRIVIILAVFVLLYQGMSQSMVAIVSQHQYIKTLEYRLDAVERKQLEDRKHTYEFIVNKCPNIDSLYAQRLAHIVNKYSNMFPLISPSLLVSLMWHESRFDTMAVSHVGARGIMQVMPKTAEWVTSNFELSKDYNLFCLEDNVRIGCVYLNDLISRRGQFHALSIYNSGRVSKVGRWYATQVQQHVIDGYYIERD